MNGVAVVWEQRSLLFDGLLNTLWITASAMVVAAVLGVVLFALTLTRLTLLRRSLWLVIDLLRCVPFMLFCYLIYYGLPSFGIVVNNLTGGIVALSVYHGAYLAELLRGIHESLPRDAEDAGRAFGFHGARLVMRIVLPPVLLAAVPMLGNQAVQVIKDSAFLVIIAVEELTYAADEIQATYYVPFASFVAAVLLYWLLCLTVEGGVRIVLNAAEARR